MSHANGKTRYGIIAWIRDIRRMRRQPYGDYKTDGTLAPMERPLDMAYWQGHVDGYNQCKKEIWQGELFEVKHVYEQR